MIIAVVNAKGGVGKSTVSTNLSACFAASGQRVLLIDADPQRSSFYWSRLRPPTLPVVTVKLIPGLDLYQEIPRYQEEYAAIVIDGGARLNEQSRSAVGIADFIILPTGPSPADISPTQEFYHEVIRKAAAWRGRLRAAVLCTMMNARTRIHLKGLQAIQEMGCGVFEHMLTYRTIYQGAFAQGMSASEYDRKSKASEEVQALFQELQEAL